MFEKLDEMQNEHKSLNLNYNLRIEWHSSITIKKDWHFPLQGNLCNDISGSISDKVLTIYLAWVVWLEGSSFERCVMFHISTIIK